MSEVGAGTIGVEEMIHDALSYCAKRTQYEDAEEARAAIQGGDCSACHYFRYGLSKSLGRYLGDVEPSILVVYTFEPDYCVAQGYAEPELGETLGINLIAVADDSKEPLMSTIASLEAELKRATSSILCSRGSGSCLALDVRVTDREEVAAKRGYGSVVCSIHVAPLKIWEREHGGVMSIDALVE